MLTGVTSVLDLYNEEQSDITVAKMRNYSKNGMYFESLHAVDPDTEVDITVIKLTDDDKTPDFKSNYIAKAVWCKEIADSTPTSYGIGVQFSDFPHE